MELKDLVGIHLMTGIETGTIKINGWWYKSNNCNYVKFRLDNITYMAVIEVPDYYRGVVHRHRDRRETVEFKWKEDYLRELIRTGNEDDIVKYIKGEL